MIPQKVIVGAGATGLSCARYFTSRGTPFRIVDESSNPSMLNKIRSELPGVQIKCGGDWDVDPLREDELVLSPGVPLNNHNVRSAIARGLKVVGDIGLFRHVACAPIVAITGSNGKSTVTSLVGEIVEETGINVAIGGNLGVPALDLLADNRDLYVLELSSFQLELVNGLGARVASVLNLSEDHLDRYPDFSAYREAKLRIFENCEQLVVNRDDQRTYPAEFSSNVISFGAGKPSTDKDFGLEEVDGKYFLVRGDKRLLHTSELTLNGQHNYLNVLAAFAIVDALGVPMTTAVDVASRFSGLQYRCQTELRTAELQVVNDSKATNVGATLAAIEGLAAANCRNIIWIAGGVGKNADFNPLHDAVKRHVKVAILFGRDARLLASAIEGASVIRNAADLESCLAIAIEYMQSGDVILFSPACASFDMFTNYVERGRVFSELVTSMRSILNGLSHG